MEQIPAREVERTMKVQEVIFASVGEEDHVVASGRNSGYQRADDASMEVWLRKTRVSGAV